MREVGELSLSKQEKQGGGREAWEESYLAHFSYIYITSTCTIRLSLTLLWHESIVPSRERVNYSTTRTRTRTRELPLRSGWPAGDLPAAANRWDAQDYPPRNLTKAVRSVFEIHTQDTTSQRFKRPSFPLTSNSVRFLHLFRLCDCRVRRSDADFCRSIAPTTTAC